MTKSVWKNINDLRFFNFANNESNVSNAMFGLNFLSLLI